MKLDLGPYGLHVNNGLISVTSVGVSMTIPVNTVTMVHFHGHTDSYLRATSCIPVSVWRPFKVEFVAEGIHADKP